MGLWPKRRFSYELPTTVRRYTIITRGQDGWRLATHSFPDVWFPSYYILRSTTGIGPSKNREWTKLCRVGNRPIPRHSLFHIGNELVLQVLAMILHGAGWAWPEIRCRPQSNWYTAEIKQAGADHQFPWGQAQLLSRVWVMDMHPRQ